LPGRYQDVPIEWPPVAIGPAQAVVEAIMQRLSPQSGPDNMCSAQPDLLEILRRRSMELWFFLVALLSAAFGLFDFFVT
jgi:hypothetical protein